MRSKSARRYTVTGTLNREQERQQALRQNLAGWELGELRRWDCNQTVTKGVFGLMGSDKNRANGRSTPTGRVTPRPAYTQLRLVREVHERPRLANCVEVLHALDAVLDAGDAVILGVTRDGGAISITVLHDDERERAYVASNAELSELAGTIADTYAAALAPA